MKEIYLGPECDQRYIKTYLENIRKLDPIEIATLPNPLSLDDRNKLDSVIDSDLFWENVDKWLSIFEKRYAFKPTIVNPKKYYTSLPEKIYVVGGFHDPSSLGYQYWYHASFVLALNKNLASKELRTVELLRSYLHDCLHHSTYRSFRRAIRIPAESPRVAKHRLPEIYREQYGINFRNQDGHSYSSPELTIHSPKTINLNLLMDGVIVLVVAEILQDILKEEVTPKDHLENEILKEILVQPFDATTLPRANKFHSAVTEPTKKFIDFWGGTTLITLVLQAMESGNLDYLKGFFQKRTGLETAWEMLFRDQKFSLPMNYTV